MRMRKILIWGLVLLAVFASCRRNTVSPRPTIPFVYHVLADSSGLYRVAAHAGFSGSAGSIAVIGQPQDAIVLARSFLTADRRDNVDGREKRDSLPDFAGESFSVILDDYNEPYSHFVTDGPDVREHLDSLREVAVRCALFAWDSTCVRNPAKILIFTSSMQAEYGLFDVDTLQQLTGGRSLLLSPAEVMLDQAYASGARQIAVWTDARTARSQAWEAVFARKGWTDARLAVISPSKALDIRTEMRDLLRKYRSTGRALDILLLDSYTMDASYLHSELDLIRRADTDEDSSFCNMLSRDFSFMEPKSALTRATYDLLRGNSLFTHRISRPFVSYYQTDESAQGQLILEEVAESYVQNAYVPHLH